MRMMSAIITRVPIMFARWLSSETPRSQYMIVQGELVSTTRWLEGATICWGIAGYCRIWHYTETLPVSIPQKSPTISWPLPKGLAQLLNAKFLLGSVHFETAHFGGVTRSFPLMHSMANMQTHMLNHALLGPTMTICDFRSHHIPAITLLVFGVASGRKITSPRPNLQPSTLNTHH